MTQVNIPPSRLAEAFEFASWLHADQYRKQTKDEDESLRIQYLTHLAEVLALVILGRGNEDQQIAALLHDALEDQPETPDGFDTEAVILEKFGQNVLDLVKACTDGVPDENGEKAPWRDRKEAHIVHLAETVKNKPAVALITLADKLSNCQAIVNDLLSDGAHVWERFNADRVSICWYYNSMFEVLEGSLGADNSLVKRLARQIVELNNLAQPVPA